MIGGAQFHVVDAFYVGKIRPQTYVCEGAILGNCLLLDWTDIPKGIGTRIIVVLIAANKGAEREYRSIAQQPSPRRGDVERLDLRTLVSLWKRITERISLADMEIIERIGILKPRTRVSKV